MVWSFTKTRGCRGWRCSPTDWVRLRGMKCNKWFGGVSEVPPPGKPTLHLNYSAAAKSRLTDVNLADTMIGKAVEHMFETEEGPKEEWRGMVLARAPIMTTWFYITYEKDPVLYMYQLLDDYKEGDLRIMPDSSKFRITYNNYTIIYSVNYIDTNTFVFVPL